MLYLSDLHRKQHHPSLSELILFSPHLPIGRLMFGFTTFIFSDLCTHRPSPGCALWHSTAKMHKTNFNITCSQHIKMPPFGDTFLSLASPPLCRYYLRVVAYYYLCVIFCVLLQHSFESGPCEITVVWCSKMKMSRPVIKYYKMFEKDFNCWKAMYR